MRVSQTYYQYDTDDWDSGPEKIVYYYHQPIKDVVVYHVINLWYKVLDIPWLSGVVCRRAKKRSELPRDCGLEHDHDMEPAECWWICPCVERDLRIHDYRNKNAELIK